MGMLGKCAQSTCSTKSFLPAIFGSSPPIPHLRNMSWLHIEGVLPREDTMIDVRFMAEHHGTTLGKDG
jgi:hypothetical protein